MEFFKDAAFSGVSLFNIGTLTILAEYSLKFFFKANAKFNSDPVANIVISSPSETTYPPFKNSSYSTEKSKFSKFCLVKERTFGFFVFEKRYL